jgi:hypothetical protein
MSGLLAVWGVAVRRNTEGAQVPDELLSVADVKLGRVANGLGLQKAQQVVRGSPVAVDGMSRGAEHLLVVFQPSPPHFGNSDGLKAQRRGGADFELGVDLGGELADGFTVRADARSMTLAVVVVAEIPDAAPEIGLNFADAERRGLLGRDILTEPSRHKTPQNATNGNL